MTLQNLLKFGSFSLARSFLLLDWEDAICSTLNFNFKYFTLLAPFVIPTCLLLVMWYLVLIMHLHPTSAWHFKALNQKIVWLNNMLVIYSNISRVIDTILLGSLVGYVGNDYPIVIFLIYDVSALEEKK